MRIKRKMEDEWIEKKIFKKGKIGGTWPKRRMKLREEVAICRQINFGLQKALTGRQRRADFERNPLVLRRQNEARLHFLPMGEWGPLEFDRRKSSIKCLKKILKHDFSFYTRGHIPLFVSK